MTLDQLTAIAIQAYNYGTDTTHKEDMRAAVITVLDAVGRECVPERRVTLRDSAQEAEHGWDACRAEMLHRLTKMRK